MRKIGREYLGFFFFIDTRLDLVPDQLVAAALQIVFIYVHITLLCDTFGLSFSSLFCVFIPSCEMLAAP